jgi:hypothetical protein
LIWFSPGVSGRVSEEQDLGHAAANRDLRRDYAPIGQTFQVNLHHFPNYGGVIGRSDLTCPGV